MGRWEAVAIASAVVAGALIALRATGRAFEQGYYTGLDVAKNYRHG